MTTTDLSELRARVRDFLDDVRVPGDRSAGAAGEGWKTALGVLGHERLSISRSGNTVARRPLPVADLVQQAERMGRTAAHRERLAHLAGLPGGTTA